MAGSRIPPDLWLPASLKATLAQDLDDLFNTTTLSKQTLTYSRFTGGSTQSVNTDTGVLSSTPYSDTTNVACFVGKWSARQLTKYPVLRAGDLKLLMRKNSVSGELTTADRVTLAARVYDVVMVNESQHVDLVAVAARLLGGQGA